MSKHCSLCGTEIKEGETACSFCGTAAPDTPETPAAAPMTSLPGKTVKKHVCSGCGKEYPNGGKFCPDCGGKIEEKTVEEKSDIIVKTVKEKKIACFGCGKEYPNGGKFCPECGGRIGERECDREAFFRIREVKKICCTRCGKEYPNGGKFCPECGGKIDGTTFREEIPVEIAEVKKYVCSGCGKEYPNGGKFCPDCGGKIGEQVSRKVVSDSAGDESEKAAVKKANPGKSAKTAGRGDTYDDWCRIGHLYQKGRCGFPLDMAKALEAYRKAASMNECRDGKYRENGYAECYLGFFYLSGNGVPQDPDTARKWFEISNACGNEHARSELVRLGCLKRPIPPKKSDPDHHRHKEKSCPEWLLPVAIMLGVIIFAILFVVLTDNLTWSRLDLIWRRF